MYTVEKTWQHKGNTCVVVMTDQGHRCGYVGITPDHPLYGKDYLEPAEVLMKYLDELKGSVIGKRGIISVLCWDQESMRPDVFFNVHGGITYSGGDPEYPIPQENTWWFGYDCAHAGDAKDLSVVSDKMRQIEEEYPTGGVLRTLEYCIAECESLSEQLDRVKEEAKNATQ
jgi:hypothetical protein